MTRRSPLPALARRALIALGLALGQAGRAAPPPFNPADLTADRSSFSSTGDWSAEGNVRLRDAESLFTADRIDYDHASETLLARGHVVFTRGAMRLLAESLSYRRGDGGFTAQTVRIGRQPYFIAGESADGTRKQVVIHRATVSYGEPGRWAPTIKADTIIFSPGHYLRLGAGRAGVGAAEIVPIPHFTQNLVRGAPLFSYMHFNVGYRSDLGGIAEVGLRAPVLPDLKLGGDLSLFTSRGVMAGPGLDYWAPDGWLPMTGELRSGFIHDYGLRPPDNEHTGYLTGSGKLEADTLGRQIPSDRGYLEWTHEQQLTEDLTLEGQVNWWKDSEVLRDFRPKEFYPVQTPDTYLESVYAWDDAFASVFTRLQPNSFDPVQRREPELDFNLMPTAIGRGYYERFDASAVRLDEKPPQGGPELSDNRLDAFYGVSRPIAPSDWLTLTPSAGGRVTNYSSTQGAAQPGGYTRVLGELGFDAVMRASGTFAYQNPLWGVDGLRHLVTPHVTYRYIPEADAGQAKIPEIDRPSFTTYLEPLELGDVRYLDELRPVNTLRLGLDNVFQTRDPAYGSRDLFSFNIADDLNFKRQFGEKDFSDIHTQTAFTPAPWLSVNADHIFDPVSMTLREFNASLSLHDDHAWGVLLAGDFLRHEDDDYTVDFFARLNEALRAHVVLEYGARQFRFNQVSAGLEQNLANIWRVQYIVTFNASPTRTGRLGFNVEIDPLKF